MKTIENLKTENWYYVQIFDGIGKGFKIHQTIIFAKNKKELEQKAKDVAKLHGLTGKISYYLKNYKIEARSMVKSGNYVE